MSQKSLFEEVELYDLAEIAQITGVSVPTLRRYIRDGRLKAQRFGGKFQATKHQVEAFLNGDNEPQVTHLGRMPEGEVTAEEDTPSAAAAEPLYVVDPDPHTAASAHYPTALQRHAGGPGMEVQRAQAASLTQPLGGEQERGAGYPPQLLFMKPEDVDKLVASLASHTEQIERRAEERDQETSELVRDLREENRQLRESIERAQDESRQAVRELSEEFTAKVLDPRREEQERIRYTMLRGKMDQVLERMENGGQYQEELPPEPRPWWRFW